MNVTIPERKVLPSGESNFLVNKRTLAADKRPMSKSTELLQGGGKADGEEPKNPFILMTALLDLGEDMCSYPGMLHGGLYSVLLDEVMGTAANFQTANAAYTAELTTKYKKPVRTPQVVLIRGRVIKKEGRKLQVRGTIEDKDGMSVPLR
ncbi:putative thioesterase thiol ester dehydrase-isomerase protein [Phaeoacremonium minimum UCRPA7]|uniref:Putative thioesterase thiol ester dehydrase-isomerase protein n=1 Tax=Phaeoacremonium minimum (strain UCR-PA7) TaxID=1286976 RepID=R8BWS4_PHAM7|nr:putative thioesterase thiol ester dehydrase-isomerase protein [Phaeoacremonium minimum UCRPA7]EOO03792.1 putative thioesterase thiol ester dehydrase-isomerase protein [Phaeoacremonium minimum UCRPA7]